MRLNRLGTKLIAVFLLVGVAMLVIALVIADDGFVGAATALFLGLMGLAYVVASLIAIGIALKARRKSQRNRWLATNGLRGRATVVDASSEMSVNLQPLYRLVLDLDFPGSERHRVTRSMIIGSFAARRMKPGLVMPAYVDPDKPDDLLIVW
jgi:hypothetical protein